MESIQDILENIAYSIEEMQYLDERATEQFRERLVKLEDDAQALLSEMQEKRSDWRQRLRKLISAESNGCYIQERINGDWRDLTYCIEECFEAAREYRSVRRWGDGSDHEEGADLAGNFADDSA